MRHRECRYCRKIGHEPEMNMFVKPEYFAHCYTQIKKYGLAWFHNECYSQYFDRWVNERKGVE